ncbi:MAG: FimB/Mfa2 family fimbrial subunit [Tannerella sp.]|jgi:hypothetical protein|nr:FimB/Mfa2 family fimbrial subunit [Tannerella sp.]
MAIWGACSSSSETPYPSGPTDEPVQSVTFTVRMPHASPQVYALDDDAENDIQTIDVLAFRIDNYTSAEYYDYRATGYNITSTSSVIPYEKQFKVTLQKNDTAHYRLVFLANVKDELDALSLASGAQKESLLARILSHNPAVWNVTSAYKPLPMWGQSAAVMVNDALATLSEITLLRSVVSIEVYADNAAVTPDFHLEDVYLYNRKVYGRVAPYENYYNATEKKVTAPTMPTVNMMLPLTVWTGQHYTVPSGQYKLTRTIYTYEAAAAANGDDFVATCLVVKGTYIPLGTPQYYRLDFEQRDNLGVFQEYRPLLRNHRYQFIIKRVTGDGHNTQDSAFFSKKGNLGVEILDWNLADMGNMVVKEMNWLNVNRTSITTYSGGEFYVGVETSHTGGWTAELENPADVSWIRAIDCRNDYMQVTLYGYGIPVGGREGNIVVRAGNMTKKINVKQIPTS